MAMNRGYILSSRAFKRDIARSFTSSVALSRSNRSSCFWDVNFIENNDLVREFFSRFQGLDLTTLIRPSDDERDRQDAKLFLILQNHSFHRSSGVPDYSTTS